MFGKVDRCSIRHISFGYIRLTGRYLLLPKLKWIRIKQHRPIPEGNKLKSATVSMEPTGKCYVSLLYEYEQKPCSVRRTGKVVGLDFSMTDLFVSSEKEFCTEGEFLHRYRASQDRLTREQRRLSHCEKGSRGYVKQKKRVALLHEKIRNQRQDYLHKQSRLIADSCDAVCVEDLDMKGMSQALHFGKSVHDNGWGMFCTFLEYKLEAQGKKLIRIDKWYPSSRKCHVCGYKNDSLQLSDRRWHCPECGTEHDRGHNASINIKEEGLRLLSA